MAKTPLSAVVVIDYQNVHLTAYDIFNRGGDRHESLIHPQLFAQTVVRERNARQRAGYPEVVLRETIAFRGLPHSHYDWEQNRRCSAQAEQWRRDGVTIELRDLKYTFQRTADGREATDVNGRKIAVGKGQEKGIDVLVALTCLRQALCDEVDVVILASRDTDLVPVLDTLLEMRAEDPRVAKIETASWFDRDAKEQGRFAGGSLRPTGSVNVWNTNLDRACYEASLDQRDYS